MNDQMSFELAGGPYAVTASRLALAGLEDRLDPNVLFDIRLLVSELVTNCVKHARVGPEESIVLSVEHARRPRARIGPRRGPGLRAARRRRSPSRPPRPGPAGACSWSTSSPRTGASSATRARLVWFELRSPARGRRRPATRTARSPERSPLDGGPWPTEDGRGTPRKEEDDRHPAARAAGRARAGRCRGLPAARIHRGGPGPPASGASPAGGVLVRPRRRRRRGHRGRRSLFMLAREVNPARCEGSRSAAAASGW